MINLMARAAQGYDGVRGEFVPDWEILLQWVEVIEVRDTNAHAQRKNEACLEIAHSHSGTASTAHPSSPEYALEDPPEGGAEETYSNCEAVEEANDGDV